jgi:hypothetical protein
MFKFWIFAKNLIMPNFVLVMLQFTKVIWLFPISSWLGSNFQFLQNYAKIITLCKSYAKDSNFSYVLPIGKLSQP